jgi:hypothetical protein
MMIAVKAMRGAAVSTNVAGLNCANTEVRLRISRKGGFMKSCTILAVTIFLLSFAVGLEAAQTFSTPARGLAEPGAISQGTGRLVTSRTLPGQLQLVEHLFTPAVLEPNGFIAACFATNLDSVDRDLAALIIDSRGVDVTETSSCGARQRPGVTCHSTAQFSADSALRCVVSTSGQAATLRGGMTTSSGPFPFVSPGNLTVTAQ